MCLNYEAQLVSEQIRVADLTKQLTMLERCREDLKTEVANRKEMEQRWNENKEEHKAQVCKIGIIVTIYIIFVSSEYQFI